jgi:sphinganine-1-phosphate aldolase
MYRSNELRRHQYVSTPSGRILPHGRPQFVTTSWPGGTYASPSLAGSRPGALIAGAWATFMSVGRDGYLESCKQIVGAAKRIEYGLRR